MIPLAPADKEALTRELTRLSSNSLVNLLIRDIIGRAESLADVHHGLSVAAKAIKAANGRVMERIEQSRT